MSKNLTRKGLALGAIVALASTVIAGSPAFAAGEVVFAPSTGTSYTTFTTADFALTASLAPGQVAGNIAQLKYQIAGDASGSFEYTIGAAAAATATTAATQVVSAGATVGTASVLNIGLKAADQVEATATKSVTVTAFIDSNNDSILDSGEFQQARTVTFKKLADVVATVTLTAPLPGDTTVKVTAALADINAEQTAANTKVTFTATGHTLIAAPGVAATTAGAYQSTLPTSGTLAAAAVVTARVYYGAIALGAAAVSATVPAASIIAPISGPVTSANAVAATAAAITAAVVRTNSAFAVEATIKSSATGNAVVASKAVTAAITVTGALTTIRTLSINGTVYNGTVALPTALALTTDAAGKAKVDLVTVGFTAGNTVVVAFSSENQTTTTTATLADTTYSVKSTAVGSVLRSITEGGSTTITYAVKDQFGVAIAVASRLKFVVGYATTGPVAAPATTFVPVVAGSASIVVTDTAANVDADIVVAVTLQTQDASNSNWSDVVIAILSHTVYVPAVATTFDVVPVAQAIALSTSEALTLSSVTNPGAAVTIASKGVTFTVNSVDYADTVTMFADTSGDIVVSAKSDIAGAHTITYTAGSETKTSVVTVTAAASNSGATLAIDAPASILPGRTLEVTVSLVDKFGNPVAVANLGTTNPTATIVYNGPGLLVGTITQTLDASGKSKFRVLLGANEIGSATITATYDLDGTTATATVLTASKTVAIAAAVVVAPQAAVIASKNGRVYVTVNSAAGFKSWVKVGFSLKPAFTTTGSKLVSYYVGAGKRVAVLVYVRGGLVASQAITVE